MALARGAGLASANAPLFASSTAALAYAQDPGTGEVDPYAVSPGYLEVPVHRAGAELREEDLAYSAAPDQDADAETGAVPVAEAATDDAFDTSERRRPLMLAGSALAVVVVSAALALEIALALGIRPAVALRPSPAQALITPVQAAPLGRPAPFIPAPHPFAVHAPPLPLQLPAPAPITARTPVPTFRLPSHPCRSARTCTGARGDSGAAGPGTVRSAAADESGDSQATAAHAEHAAIRRADPPAANEFPWSPRSPRSPVPAGSPSLRKVLDFPDGPRFSDGPRFPDGPGFSQGPRFPHLPPFSQRPAFADGPPFSQGPRFGGHARSDDASHAASYVPPDAGADDARFAAFQLPCSRRSGT